MGIWRGIWGVIVGIIVGFMIGALFDYFRLYVFNLKTEDMVLVYPYVAGVASLFASIVALTVAGAWIRPKRQPEVTKPEPRIAPQAQAPIKKDKLAEQKPKPAGGLEIKESADIPGMPTFDYTGSKDPGLDDPAAYKPGSKSNKSDEGTV